MEIKKINIKDLEQNTGQIVGLPANPRQWTKDELETLKASIIETPELMEARGAIVYPYEGKYIVLGGNMRMSAVQSLGWKEMPCVVLPSEMPVEKLKEIVLKDNGMFGEWDADALANEWDDLPLADWGVKIWGMEDNGIENREESTKGESTKRLLKIKVRDITVELSEDEEERLYGEMSEYIDENGLSCGFFGNLLGYAEKGKNI